MKWMHDFARAWRCDAIACAAHARHSFLVFALPQLAVDLLNPTTESEARRHKLKRLVQSPNSFFMVRSLFFVASFFLFGYSFFSMSLLLNIIRLILVFPRRTSVARVAPTSPLCSATLRLLSCARDALRSCAPLQVARPSSARVCLLMRQHAFRHSIHYASIDRLPFFHS